ncbi:hypothetical protein PMZ80_010041 [Knufia obscura]|uniref:Uncharacterized protein n=2 Tax=Knufia TaxID=430999 RepID=A0AAN8F3Y5_9EURO|nr:hypothetical protein PMZ80_010041 [Knufia obscura]KAK5956128.1 hypothetical protein OHC33_002701 [Knufia fluminis]
MRFDSLPPSLLSLLTLTLLRPVTAGLIPDLLSSLEDLQNFAKRCENPCGYYGQLCCESGQTCITDVNGQAQCGAGTGSAVTQAAGGSWEYYTTTYVQTDLQTVTETFSSYLGATTAATTSLSCSYAQGQSPCGNMCCNSGQYCQQAGMCVAVPGSSGYYSSLATVTVTDTASAGAPLRPTTNAVTTITSTGTAATTVPYQTPVGTGGAVLTGTQAESTGGLSGGAIAGIVIGVILGIILLLLICACCCFKGLLDGLLAIFGLGPRRRRRREEVEVYEERHHHHSGGAAAGRTWYGAQKPARSHYSEKQKKKSGLGGFGKAAVFLGGLGAILGLKRKHDRRDDKSSSGYSYYGSDYYTSSSKLSLH